MIYSHCGSIAVPTTFAFAMVLSVAACAPEQHTRVPPPAPGIGGPATTAPAQPQGAPAQGSGGVILSGPEGAQRIKPGTVSQARQADLESCYNFARAQVEHDRRIEQDSDAAFDAFPSGLGIGQLRGDMNEFGRKNRRASLYSDCMAAKGYSRQ